MYLDVIRKIGAPNLTITDNARVMTGSRWQHINRTYCIDDGRTVPHHQNQNTAESRIGKLKLSLLKLYQETPLAPLSYWCYAAEFLNTVRPYLAQTSLNGRSGREILRGEMPDISIFRFPWFSPVWYYDPAASFPHGKMLPGFFLGVAESVGDGFSYIILPCEKYEDIPTRRNPITLIRSVVRKREINASPDATPICQEVLDGFKFTNIHGEELTGDDLAVAPSEEPSAENMDEDSNPLEDAQDAVITADDNAHNRAVLNNDMITPGFAQLPPISEEPDASELHMINQYSSTNDTPLASPTTNDVSPTDDSDNDEPMVPLVSQTQSEEDDDGSVESPTDVDPARLVHDVNNFFNRVEDDDTDDLHAILGWRYADGMLELEVEYSSGETKWHPYSMVQDEDPHAVAEWVLDTDLGTVLNGRHRRWARKFLRSVKRTMRRMHRTSWFQNVSASFASEVHPETDDKTSISEENLDFIPTRSTRRADAAASGTGNSQKKRKPKCKNSNKQMGNFKYGLEVPSHFKRAVQIDHAANNRKWQDAVIKEMAALIHLKCFDFKSPNFKPPADYQKAPLKLIFDIKSDLRYKARLVCQGFKVDPRGLSTRATVVKNISVRLLDLVAAHTGLSVLTGDIGNAFVQAETKEKVYCVCGPEFGDRMGCIALIKKALYGLTTSAERYRKLFADFLRSLGFTPTRYDRDVWMRMRESHDGYDYICTHVDDFKIVARDPSYWMTRVEQAFLVKESGPPSYYLGNDYTYHEGDGQDMWTYGCKTYVEESIRRVESEFGHLRKNKSPLPQADTHPETDTSPLLSEKDHRKFQMLLGMMQWMETIGRPDLAFACSSLNRFGACPREKHLDMALHVFGYLKRFPDKRIAIDPRPLVYDREHNQYQDFAPDFLEDYPDAKEDMDPGFPEAFGVPLETTIMVDADHAHDLVTRRSITGLLLFVGSTPVKWVSKRQGSIASSTYSSEFAALRTAVEEAQNVRYMLRCLGIPIPSDGSCPTRIFGDNLSVIQNAKNPEAELKKKHVAVSFHVVREAIASGTVYPAWLYTKYNISDINTKIIPSNEFNTHCDHIFWRPNFSLHSNNRLGVGEESGTPGGSPAYW